MNDGDKPQLYREAAESLRRLASQAPLPDIQGDVLDLSARFERMAMYFEAQLRLGAAGEERDDQTTFGCGAALSRRRHRRGLIPYRQSEPLYAERGRKCRRRSRGSPTGNGRDNAGARTC